MSAEEKMRTSGDIPRDGASSSSAPILPTVNPDAEKSQSSKPTIPAAVYVMYVNLLRRRLIS